LTEIGAASELEVGDITHLLDGDYVMFSRQPHCIVYEYALSLRKSLDASVIRHFTNVADTKPHNADFDGDEMNFYMPEHSSRRGVAYACRSPQPNHQSLP
jgi:DNA-directed RNA polymerase beta' subunit